MSIKVYADADNEGFITAINLACLRCGAWIEPSFDPGAELAVLAEAAKTHNSQHHNTMPVPPRTRA